MAEPEAVAATEVTPQVVKPVVVEPAKEPEPAPAPATPDEDREPSGDSPEAVFARKQYREAKEARRVAAEREREARDEREARIRLEEQLRLAKEAPVQREEKIYSIAEVRQAVRDGRITEDQGDGYIQDTIIPHQIKQTLEAERRKQTEQQPLERALADVEAYKAEIPDLNDPRSESFRKVAVEYQRLVKERGMPNNYVTQALAVETTLGKLSDIRKRSEVDRTTRASLSPAPVDATAGGAGVSGQAVDLTKAPPGMRAMWERNGDSVEARKRELKIYLDLKASGRRF